MNQTDLRPRTLFAISCVLIAAWCLMHVPGVLYGTQNVPLHQSYIGDEQSPVNGALHMLEAKSLLAIRGDTVLYYGPVFPLFAIPAVLADFAVHAMNGSARSAAAYRNLILFNWGGIILWIHVLSVALSVVALVAFFAVLRQGSRSRWMPLVATGILALNYYFFEYSHFFKHWIIVIPALLIQFATMLAINRAPRKRWWMLHAAAALAAAGVSYISLLSMIMWLPTLYAWLRARQWKRLRRFTYLCLALLAGLAIIILWDPYPFTRLLGFVGVGASRGHTDQNPLASGSGSYGYYGIELLLNHLAFFLGAAIIVAALGVRRAFGDSVVLGALFVAAVNFLLFAPATHHEGRYMLPTIVFLLLALGRLLVLYVDAPRPRYRSAVIAALAFGVLFHVVSIAGWMAAYAKGPAEARMLESLPSVQQPILSLTPYLLAVPHTPAAYRAYASSTGKSDVNLYKALFAAKPPEGVKTYDIRYATSTAVSTDPALLTGYPTIVTEFQPRGNELNQFDYIDEDIARIWFSKELLPSFHIFSNPGSTGS